jgi:(E)-4-hydroxy-3-methylbut-2-enyl-diphosphate synthase
MGCVVNGPGEAREADFGVACGDGSALLFQKGEPLRKVAPDEIVSSLLAMVRELEEKGEQ